MCCTCWNNQDKKKPRTFVLLSVEELTKVNLGCVCSPCPQAPQIPQAVSIDRFTTLNERRPHLLFFLCTFLRLLLLLYVQLVFAGICFAAVTSLLQTKKMDGLGPATWWCFCEQMNFQFRKTMHMLFLVLLVALCFHSVTFQYVASILLVWYLLDNFFFVTKQ